MANDPLAAGVKLLERWLPGVRVSLVHGEAPRALDVDWEEQPPSLAQVAQYAGFAGRAERRPVAVQRFEIEDADEMFGAHRAAAGFPDAGAEQALAFLVPVLEAAAGPLDRRTRAVAAFVAGMLVEDNEDLLRIQVAAEPGGSPLEDEVHLMVRTWRGDTGRLSVAPAGATPPDQGDAESRIACLTTLLSELLYINNNNQVTFEVTFMAHDLPVSVDLDAADAALRAAPPPGIGWDFAETPEEEDDDGLLLRWSLDELEAALADSERALIELAWGTGMGAGGSPSMEDPGDHFVHWLLKDLLNTIRAEVTGTPDGPPRLAYGKGLPLELTGDGACLVLVGPDRIAVIDIDDGC
ncbi:hypothetical protein [Spirillospora sp. NPDC077959]|uniref:hypothetical protein n=1 Tax=Spirillospora sp. NPDC077959 TaxID=3364529 RepID=UPI0037D679E3